MKKDLYGKARLENYEKGIPVLSLDEYKKDQGQDEFSRKQVWFYVYGDEEIEKEFEESLNSLISSRFLEDNIEWDLITLYPTHVEGEVNQHMEKMLKSISKDVGIEYRRALKRIKTIEENHELDSIKAKTVNLEGSIQTENVEDKNVILVDNIALSGVSLLHGANKLLENGAKNVFGLTLGMGETFRKKKWIPRGKKASELMEEEAGQ